MAKDAPRLLPFSTLSTVPWLLQGHLGDLQRARLR